MSNYFTKLSKVFLVSQALTSYFPSIAHATTLTWNGTAGASWDTTGTNWTPSESNPWDSSNGSTNAATFGGAGSASVNGNVTANALNYTAATGTFNIDSNTITLAGATPTVTVANGGALSVSSVISGTDGLTMAGLGTLTLSGSNTYSGNTKIGSASATGKLILANSSALGSSSAVTVF
jgi:fibronectin-binding autotransporter adhesin